MSQLTLTLLQSDSTCRHPTRRRSRRSRTSSRSLSLTTLGRPSGRSAGRAPTAQRNPGGLSFRSRSSRSATRPASHPARSRASSCTPARKTSCRSEVSLPSSPRFDAELFIDVRTCLPPSEPFVVELVAHNPLDAPLSLGDVTLDASLVSKDTAKIAPEGLEIETIPGIRLEPGETRRVSSTVRPRLSFVLPS